MCEVTIQIVSYNSCERLRQTLTAVVENCADVNHEIIVVDNASQDDTLDMLAEQFPDVTVIANPKNVFFSPAHNQASQQANGEYLLILNSDITLPPGVLRKMVDYLNTQTDAGCCSPLLANEDGVQTSYWNERTPWQLARMRAPFANLPKLKNGVFNPPLETSGFGDEEAGFTDIASDACLLIRKELFERIGKYDERMQMYFTEDDICLRVRAHNYKVAVLKSVQVFHEGGHSTRKVKKLSIVDIERKDQYIYFLKHRGRKDAMQSFVYGWLERICVLAAGK